ncbi:MAG: hypothetical protein AAF551_15620, partial [Bacteroidota bacterium]
MTKVNVQSKPITVDQECPEYLPIKQFMEKMTTTEEVNPYSSTFSFIPFIEKMRMEKKKFISTGRIMDMALFNELGERLLAFANDDNLDSPEKRQELVSILFPSLFFDGQLGFVAKPFTKEFFYLTPAVQEIFASDEWEVKISGHLVKGKMGSPAIEAGRLILDIFHGYKFESNSYQIMTFRHRETMLERHFKVNVILDFIKATPLKEVKELDAAQVHELFNEWDNEQFWLEHFPPEDFVFEGLVIGYIQDVTEVEVLSNMKEMMISDKDADLEEPDSTREELTSLIRSYLGWPDVSFGSLLNRDFKYAKLFSWSILGGIDELAPFTRDDFYQSSTYGKVLNSGDVVIIGDLQQMEQPTEIESRLIKKGYRSLLLSPQKDKNGYILGIMELASDQAYRFNKQTLTKLSEIISLFSVGTNRWIQEMDNHINFFIQKQFTYIHPSVEWKFQEVSQKFLFASLENGQKPTLETIVFKEVYPLYGQADIVGSSKIRNRSIEADMLDNL